jgi:hypothetical protein
MGGLPQLAGRRTAEHAGVGDAVWLAAHVELGEAGATN